MDPGIVPEGAPVASPGLPEVQVSQRPEPAPAVTPEPPAPPTTDAPQPTEVEELPDWAQKLIRETREEAARTRVEAKKHAAEEAAKNARDQLAQEIGRALGIVPDAEGGGDEVVPPTAEELLSQLTTEQASTRTARVELAVYKAASVHSADPLALLDSRSFLDAVSKLDPSDSDSLNAAIREAVESNPRLKVNEPAPAAEPEPTPPPSGGTFAGGPSGRGNDVSTMSIDDFRKQYAAGRRR
jgi:hypothetical protein